MTTEIAIAKTDYSFVATTPAQMEIAQRDMIRWCGERLEREKLELADLERTIAEAQKAGMNVAAWKRRLSMSRAKMIFYRKVKGALMKGYYIVPPFDVQLFAIRTERGYTKGHRQDYRSDFEQRGQILAEGEGEWRNPWPQVRTGTEAKRDANSNIVKDQSGKAVMQRWWAAGNWRDVDFPFKFVKPEVIAAVRGALESKIFDALGVLPKYRNPDPIVVGQIFPPHKPYEPLTFFVAWWMDPKDL